MSQILEDAEKEIERQAIDEIDRAIASVYNDFSFKMQRFVKKSSDDPLGYGGFHAMLAAQKSMREYADGLKENYIKSKKYELAQKLAAIVGGNS